jgi:hypothetical protein
MEMKDANCMQTTAISLHCERDFDILATKKYQYIQNYKYICIYHDDSDPNRPWTFTPA